MKNVLMCASVKTGQHWVVWIIANYQRLINNKPKMTWKEILGYSKLNGSIDGLAPNRKYNSETIHFVRVEYPYGFNSKVKRFMKSFDKLIYLYRNPYDTLISMFYYFHTDPILIKIIREKEDFKGDEFFEEYVKSKLDKYLSHIERSIDHADLVLYYDDLLKDTSPFRTVLSYFYDKIDEDIFQKTLRISSFNYVNSLEALLKKETITFKGRKNVRFHARDGSSGQYRKLMSFELINYITQRWNALKMKVKYKLK